MKNRLFRPSGRQDWANLRGPFSQPRFWIGLAASLPMAALSTVATWLLLASLLIAPSGWIVYFYACVVALWSWFWVKSYRRVLDTMRHLREVGAPFPPINLKGMLVTLSLFMAIAALLLPTMCTFAIQPKNRAERAFLANEFKAKTLPFLPDLR
ncbi:MAG: hypothetical protein KF784_08155 [Fimbriimonadaceae bacterium]|nr:hypothetical protein [Fimbriimonadaceae bacterium]